MKNFAVYALIGLGALAYNLSTTADRDGSGAIIDAGSIDAFSLRVGDCFDDSAFSAVAEADEVQSLPGVPCADPHDNEVYAVFNVDMQTFPSEDELSLLAFDRCYDRFESFVGRDYESSQLDILTLYPTKESWQQMNDREIVCAVFDVDANKLTGSAEGTGI